MLGGSNTTVTFMLVAPEAATGRVASGPGRQKSGSGVGMGSPSLREALRGLYVRPAEAVSFSSRRSFLILLNPVQDFCTMFHLAVRTLDAVDLTMLPLDVSRMNESRSFILKLPRSCIMTVGSAKVDRPVRHRRSPCEDYATHPSSPRLRQMVLLRAVRASNRRNPLRRWLRQSFRLNQNPFPDNKLSHASLAQPMQGLMIEMKPPWGRIPLVLSRSLELE